MDVMNNNGHSSEHEPVLDDEGSITSYSIFDELVNEVLDGGEVSVPSSITVMIARRELHDLLLVDPEAIRRPVPEPGEPYKYPLNLAIHYNATADVIRMLLEADPTVTSLPDGDENQGSLHILLRQQRNRNDMLPLVDSFLLAHPTCTQIQDSQTEALSCAAIILVNPSFSCSLLSVGQFTPLLFLLHGIQCCCCYYYKEQEDHDDADSTILSMTEKEIDRLDKI
jgi:hypothetical protein